MEKIIKDLKDIFKNKKLIELVLQDEDHSDDDSIYFGHVIAVSDEYVLLEHITSRAVINGYMLVKIRNISKIIVDTDYLKRLQEYIKIRKTENSFNCLSLSPKNYLDEKNDILPIEKIVDIASSTKDFLEVCYLENFKFELVCYVNGPVIDFDEKSMTIACLDDDELSILYPIRIKIKDIIYIKLIDNELALSKKYYFMKNPSIL